MTRTTTALVPFVPLLVAALAVVEGLQLLRSAIAGLSVYVGQIRDLDTSLLGGLIFAIFLLAGAAPAVRRLLGPGRAFLVLAGVLALLRLAEQFTVDPDAALVLSIAGVIVWLWLVQFVVVGDHAPGAARSTASPVIVLLLGIAVDTAITGAFGSLDLSFSSGLAAKLTTLSLASVQLAAIVWLAGSRAELGGALRPPGSAYVVGSALALHLLIFQNMGSQVVLSGWALPAVFAWTLAANLLALVVAVELRRRGSAAPGWLFLVAGAVLVVSVGPSLPTPLVVAGALVGPAAIALFLVAALRDCDGAGSGWLAVGLGFLAIPLVLFGWYAHYDFEVPVPQAALPLIAAALIAVPALWVRRSPVRERLPASRAVLIPALLLLLLPLSLFLSWNSPTAPPAAAPLRVMSYNIHQGFDLDGRPNLEAVARVIEAEQPQVVALQEVPRGWLANGSVDALSWLAQRLRMHAAWGPAADPFWGNAVLSRFPILEVENRPMPNNDELLFDRAYLIVTIDAAGEPIQVVATHLHHVRRQPQHRLPQVQALLDGVDWNRPTILLGDLNAQPQHEEIRLLIGSGLATAPTPIPTYPADQPRRQIDYVFVTTHFTVSEMTAIATTASDHLPVVATLLEASGD